MKPTPDNRGPIKVAPLHNVQLFLQLCHRVVDAPDYLTNWACFYGPPGYGKSTCCGHAQIRLNAINIECGSTWTAAALVDALEAELSIPTPRSAVYKRLNAVIQTLADDPRLLIFDEANHLTKKKLMDVLREISGKSGAPMIFVGTDKLPSEMKAFEIAASRTLEWVPVRPCKLADAKELAVLYGQGVSLTDDLMAAIVKDTEGVTRQIVVNIDRAVKLARTTGQKVIDRETYSKGAQVYVGSPKNSWRDQINKIGSAA